MTNEDSSLRIQLSSLWSIPLILPILTILALATGCRPLFVGSDTISYVISYQSLSLGINSYNYEFLFALFANCFAQCFSSTEFFFTALAIINYSILLLLAIQINSFLKLKNTHIIFLLLIIFSSFSPFFYAIQVNVIRHGVAILALLLFYLLLLNRAGFLKLVLVGLFALGFHKTTVVYIGLSGLLFFSYSFVSRTVFILAFLYASGITKKAIFLFSQYSPINLYEKIYSYGLTAGYNSGNRIDFTSFTLISGLIFFIIAKYLLVGENKKKFMQFLKIYWILTIPFFIFGFASFADRYLLPAWVYLCVLSAVFSVLLLPKSNLVFRGVYLLFLFTSILYYAIVQGILR
ncbi:EpsG family protein [Legionella jamestowniensis]|nr:EpsG family protein [Legionella jamestowniensis]